MSVRSITLAVLLSSAAGAAVAQSAPDMQAVLDAQAILGAKPIELLTPLEARIHPSPADAAMAVMRALGLCFTQGDRP